MTRHDNGPKVVKAQNYDILNHDDPVEEDAAERLGRHGDAARYSRKQIDSADPDEDRPIVVELLTLTNGGGRIVAWVPGESSLEHIWKPARIDGEAYHKFGEAHFISQGDQAAAVYQCIKSHGDVNDVIDAASTTELLHLAERENIEF